MQKISKLIFHYFIYPLALLIAAELAVRLFAPQKTDYTPLNGKTLGEPDSLIGHINRPGAHILHSEPEFQVEYRVNQDGFRDSSLTGGVDSTKQQILLLGDSFTFGVGCPVSDIWATALARKLQTIEPDIRIINGGVPGFDTRQELQLGVRLIQRYHPKLVVVAFQPSDIYTNTVPGENERYDFAEYLKRNPSITYRGFFFGQSLHVLSLWKRILLSSDWVYNRFYLMGAGSLFLNKPEQDSVFLNKQIDITTELFARLNAVCDSNRARLLVVTVPQRFQVYYEANREKIAGINVHYIDSVFSTRFGNRIWQPTFPDFVSWYRNTRIDPFYRLDGHFTKNGNQLFADAVFRSITRTIYSGIISDTATSQVVAIKQRN